MHAVLGGYRPGDIEVVCAFDIDRRKVGATLDVAALALPNNTRPLHPKLPRSSVVVEMGPVLDGVAEHMSDVPRGSDVPWSPIAVRSTSPRRSAGAAPRCWSTTCRWAASGRPSTMRAPASKRASRWSTASPSSSPPTRSGPASSSAGASPSSGDDVKSQLGATIVHRALAQLFADRGLVLDRTYQLNVGGNTDFLNMLDHVAHGIEAHLEDGGRAERAAASAAGRGHPHRPSDYVPWQRDNKVCFLRMEGRGFGNAPVELELRLSVQDSPNSAGCVIDAIRCCRVARDRGVGGPLLSVSSYLMKHPPAAGPGRARRATTSSASCAASWSARRAATPVECRPGTAAAAALVIGATIALALRGLARTEIEESEERAAGRCR